MQRQDVNRGMSEKKGDLISKCATDGGRVCRQPGSQCPARILFPVKPAHLLRIVTEKRSTGTAGYGQDLLVQLADGRGGLVLQCLQHAQDSPKLQNPSPSTHVTTLTG